MGHDIDICSFVIEDDIAIEKYKQSKIYLSYNWGDLSNICPVHFLQDDGSCPDKSKCEKIHLWHCSDDCHAHRGDDIVIRTKCALEFLAQHDILPGTPDLTNFNWGYGNIMIDKAGEIVELPPRQRLAVFAYHLKRILRKAVRYSDCFFISDSNSYCDLILPDGTSIPQCVSYSDSSDSSDSSSDDSSNENTKRPYYLSHCDESGEDLNESTNLPSSQVAYFRHPTKGNFRVDSFKRAMEVYGILSGHNDSTSESWYTLAFQMPDAPSAK